MNFWIGKLPHLIRLFFFSVLFIPAGIFAASKVPSQEEVYIWGAIFFLLSVGSVLLVVNLFPKSEAYKKQMEQQARAVKTAKVPVKETPKNEEKPKETSPATTMVTAEVPTIKTQVLPVTEPSIKTEVLLSRPDISLETTKEEQKLPPAETEKKETAVQENISAPKEAVPLNNESLFKTKNPEMDNMCREFLNKLGTLLPYKSLSIYFIKADQFTRFLEKKTDGFVHYDPIAERNDITADVAKFLKNKLGAFSSTQSDAILPLVSADRLYGAVKIQFSEAKKNLDINPAWAEVKAFAKFIGQSISSTQTPVIGSDTAIYSLDHFHNILNYRTNLNIPQNLTLIRVVQSSDKPKAVNGIAAQLKEVLGKKPEVYKIAEDTIAVFLNIESREKLSKSLGEILGALRKTLKIDINVGSADYSSFYKSPDKWYEKSVQALNESVVSGPNKYKLYIEKT